MTQRKQRVCFSGEGFISKNTDADYPTMSYLLFPHKSHQYWDIARLKTHIPCQNQHTSVLKKKRSNFRELAEFGTESQANETLPFAWVTAIPKDASLIQPPPHSKAWWVPRGSYFKQGVISSSRAGTSEPLQAWSALQGLLNLCWNPLEIIPRAQSPELVREQSLPGYLYKLPSQKSHDSCWDSELLWPHFTHRNSAFRDEPAVIVTEKN